MNKAIFLDRDGVINVDKDYIFKIEDFDFIDGVFESCLKLIKLGYLIFIVTNQSGISRGYYSESDFKKLNDWMLEQFNINNIKIIETFYCPHNPESNCSCRKPKPGMLLEAKKIYGIDMENSWLVGDQENDIMAANNAGIKNTILVRSGHEIDEKNSNAKHIFNSIREIEQAFINN